MGAEAVRARSWCGQVSLSWDVGGAGPDRGVAGVDQEERSERGGVRGARCGAGRMRSGVVEAHGVERKVGDDQGMGRL
jgi:hypothetical protein